MLHNIYCFENSAQGISRITKFAERIMQNIPKKQLQTWECQVSDISVLPYRNTMRDSLFIDEVMNAEKQSEVH